MADHEASPIIIILTDFMSSLADILLSIRTKYAGLAAKPGLAHVLMTTWALDFESRDFRFLAQESGILPTLQAMVTLTNTADMASSALTSLCSASKSTRSGASLGTQFSAVTRQRWTPWSLESVREYYMQVGLLCTL